MDGFQAVGQTGELALPEFAVLLDYWASPLPNAPFSQRPPLPDSWAAKVAWLRFQMFSSSFMLIGILHAGGEFSHSRFHIGGTGKDSKERGTEMCNVCFHGGNFPVRQLKKKRGP